jgi:hypothetical protein
MTTDREMSLMHVAQQEVIATLHAIGQPDLADRLERCAAVRLARQHGDGWPRICRSPACVWCRRPMIRGWWSGFCDWAAEARSQSLAIMGVDSSVGLPVAVRRLRRALRDVRDRTARRRRQWRDLCLAGMVGGDHTALILVIHEGIDQRDVQGVLRRRWPDMVVKQLEQEHPAIAMSPADAASLGACRRGIEPLRVAVMGQLDRQPIAPVLEPMPVLV